QSVINRARFNEQEAASIKKAESAELDVVRSDYELAVGNEVPKDQLEALQIRVDQRRESVDKALDFMQDSANYRKGLENTLAELFASEADAQKELDELNGKLTQLDVALRERENNAMKQIIGLPIIDAFSPKKLDQIWLPRLTINYNFRDV